MIRKVIAGISRHYNRGRKVGLGWLLLECGHRVPANNHKPASAYCSRCGLLFSSGDQQRWWQAYLAAIASGRPCDSARDIANHAVLDYRQKFASVKSKGGAQ